MLFIEPVRIIVGKYADVKKLDVFLERTFSMLEIKPQIKDHPQACSATSITSSKIEFKNVEFSYNPDEKVIKGITFAVQDKSLVGIVGLSGAGKSTLISLMLRFYDPVKGLVVLGGKILEIIASHSFVDTLVLFCKRAFSSQVALKII